MKKRKSWKTAGLNWKNNNIKVYKKCVQINNINMKKKVSQIQVNKDLSGAIKKAVEEQGGWKSFIGSGDRVLLKPNFNTSDTYPGSTDPEFLREVTRQVLALGVKKVMIGDSSTMMAKTEEVLKEVGVYELEKMDKRVKVVNFDDGKWVKKEVPGGKYLKHVSLPEILEDVDKMVFLPCLKTHFLARYTGALKLAVGLMRPRERLGLHAAHLQEKTAEINAVARPDLVIMDGRTCFIDRGPMDGPRRDPDLLLASTDRVELDVEGIRIIQSYDNNSLSDTKAEELPQIKRAREMGIS